MKVNVSRLLFGSVAAAAAASSALQGARAATVEGTGSPGEGFGTCSSGDCENGWGVKDYGEDYLYEGEFRDGEHHGVGIESMPEGIQYIGQFKEGTPFGLGTMRFPAQAQAAPARGYTGQWKNDWPDGCGRDGDSEGIFVEGAFTEPADCSKELAAAEALVRSVLERAGYDSEAFFATGGGGGDSGQEQQLTKEELEEYMQGVRAAIEEHRQKGEDEHVAQATQVLEDMQRQYDALLRGEGQPPAQSYTASDESAAELLERIEQVREAIQMHEERGESEHVEGATQVLRELEAQLDEVRNGGGSYGGDDDISVEELMERIEQVREAIQMHEERGESEHVEGATQVLRELEAELSEKQDVVNIDVDGMSVEDIRDRVELLKVAVRDHEEAGEDDHALQASRILRAYQRALAREEGVVDSSYPSGKQQKSRPSTGGRGSGDRSGQANAGSNANDASRSLEDLSRDELAEVIRQTHGAYQRHVEAGEDEHVEGAGLSLLSLRSQLSRLSGVYEVGSDGTLSFAADNLEHVANHVLEAELENLLAVEDLLRSRGQPTDSLQGVLEHLQSVTAAQSGKPATAGGFGRPEDEQPPTAAELRERLRIVKQAIRDHEAAGETDHARGATEVLNDLERELARLQ